MSLLRRVLDRLIPALVTAGGVTLVAAGLLTYTAPPTAGDLETPAPPVTATPTAASPSATASVPVASGTLPPLTPSASPPPAVSTRVVVDVLGIDLPVVAGDLEVPGNPGGYPLCDVAQYLPVQNDPVLSRKIAQPGQPGFTAYLYAHAREDMFLPLLEASQQNRGRELVGETVRVYTSDDRLYLYEIFRVKRHATDFTLAMDVGTDEQRLVLQTSEGPSGTIPKLQVGARLVAVQDADPAEARPSPEPRVCA